MTTGWRAAARMGTRGGSMRGVARGLRPWAAAVALAFVAASGDPAIADEAADIAAAQAAAASWLAIVDRGDAAGSWDAAASLFRAGIPMEAWKHALSAARGPFGRMEERKAASATVEKTLPGAPDGLYVVLRYSTRFEHKAAAVETVTPMREKDGSWKVSGYQVR